MGTMESRTDTGHVEHLLNVVEAAERMHVSPYTVRAWIRSGKLNATKLGRLVRIEPIELQNLISAGKKGNGHE